MFHNQALVRQAAQIIFSFKIFEITREVVNRRFGERAWGQGEPDTLRNEDCATRFSDGGSHADEVRSAPRRLTAGNVSGMSDPSLTD